MTIHILPSGRFSFHEDDFSGAEFHDEAEWFDHPLAFLQPETNRKKMPEHYVSRTFLVAVFYFRSGYSGKRDETRLVGQDAEDLRTILKSIAPRIPVEISAFPPGATKP